jgi:hypothetical protein
MRDGGWGGKDTFAAARQEIERLSLRMSNQFGDPGASNKWSAPTLFVPGELVVPAFCLSQPRGQGHSLDASSWKKAARYPKKGGNGQYAAVYNALDGKFHKNTAKGRLLSNSEVATTNIDIINFKDRFAGRVC